MRSVLVVYPRLKKPGLMVGTDAIVAIISPATRNESRKMPAGGCVWGISDRSVEGAMRLVFMRWKSRMLVLFLEVL